MSGRQLIPQIPSRLQVQGSFEAQHTDSNAVRFLDLIKPFTPLLPEVSAPEAKVPFQNKLMWTGCEYTATHEQVTRLTELQ